jgi:hypothetical protein
MADNKYRSLNYNHTEINALLEKIQKGFVLSESEYDKLINEIGLENISVFDGDYEKLENKPQIPEAMSDLKNDMNFANADMIDGKVNDLRQEIGLELEKKVGEEAIEILTVRIDENEKELIKKVDVREGYDLLPEDEIQRLSKVDNYDDQEIRMMMDEKADKSELFSKDYNELINKPEIPSLEGLATEQYVGQLIADLVDFAPDAMNTLKELADAIEEHQDVYDLFAKSQAEALSGKVDKVEGKDLMDVAEMERLAQVDNFDATELWNMFEVDEPYMSTHANGKLYVFACGYPILVEGREDGGVDIMYAFQDEIRGFQLDEADAQRLIVVGGFGEKQIDFRHILPCAAIHVRNAKIYGVHGANYFEGNVGKVNVLIENSEVKNIMGGGDSGKRLDDRAALRNIVGEINMVLNDVKGNPTVFAAGSGHCTVSKCYLEINGDCEIAYAVCGPANGYCKDAKMVINGGIIKCAQSANRGMLENFEIEMNGGNVDKFYFGGDIEDASVDGVFRNGFIKLNAGTINKLYAGTNNGIEISNKEMKGVIRNTKVFLGDVSVLEKIEMPADAKLGDCIFDVNLNKPIWFNGVNWVDASGKIVG